nr:hypothetical protein [Tanacetum cinerariifolium]
MTKGCSVWSIKYIVDTDDFMTPLLERWSIQYIVWSLVVGEKEEDSFLVVNLYGKPKKPNENHRNQNSRIHCLHPLLQAQDLPHTILQAFE